MHLRMAGWRQRLEQHTYCVAEELDEEDGIHTIEREACGSESHATVRMRTTLGSTRSSPCERHESVAHASVRGKRKHREIDGLENDTYRTRPRRQASQPKITCKGTPCKLQLSKSLLISSSSGSILGAHRLCRRLRRGTRG